MKRKLLSLSAIVLSILLLFPSSVFAEGDGSTPDYTVSVSTNVKCGIGGSAKIVVNIANATKKVSQVAVEMKYDTRLSLDTEKSSWTQSKDGVFASVGGEITSSGTETTARSVWAPANDIRLDGNVFETVFNTGETIPIGSYKIVYTVKVMFADASDWVDKYTMGYVEVVSGVSISGTVTSSAVRDNPDAAAKVTLLKDGQTVGEPLVIGEDGTYNFDGLTANEDYILRVEKAKHCTRDYEINIVENTVKNVEIWHYGDVNHDGEIDATDVAQIQRYVVNNKKSCLFEESENQDYMLQVADIDKNDEIDAVDVLQLQRFIVGSSKSVINTYQ